MKYLTHKQRIKDGLLHILPCAILILAIFLGLFFGRYAHAKSPNDIQWIITDNPQKECKNEDAVACAYKNRIYIYSGLSGVMLKFVIAHEYCHYIVGKNPETPYWKNDEDMCDAFGFWSIWRPLYPKYIDNYFMSII